MRNRETAYETNLQINLMKARIAKMWKEWKRNPNPVLKSMIEEEEVKLAIALEKQEADRHGI